MKLQSREKLLIVFVLIAIAIWGFDKFYYTPQDRKIKQFKGEVRTADQKMEQLLLLRKGVESVEAEVARLEKELKGLSERTLKGEEFRAFLRHLAQESNVLQMKIISLTPREEGFPPGEGKKESSSQYRKVTIQMVLHSNYARLGTYLMDIGKLPLMINIDSLEIERNEESLPLLKITMGLSIYMMTL